jgi:uncharacterized protein YndB with AHSA1/START domain
LELRIDPSDPNGGAVPDTDLEPDALDPRDTVVPLDAHAEVVERTVEIDLPVEELWSMISDAEELATWMADEVELEITTGATGTITDDDVTYEVEVDEVAPGERVVWRWRPVDAPADEGASRVELVVEPGRDGGRLTIIETRPALPVAALQVRGDIDGPPMGFRWELRTGLASLRADCRTLA